MFTEKNLVFPMPKTDILEYLREVVKHEHTFLEYLEGKPQPASIAYQTYATRVKTGVPIAEIEGMAQVIRYIESLPILEKETFLYTVRKSIESASDDVEVGSYETMLCYSDETTQTVDIVDALTNQSYTVPTNAILMGVIIGQHVKTIGYDAFRDCVSLASATIPNGVVAIAPYAFSNCISLASVNIPDSVTIIGMSAFFECRSLTSITIPNSVKTIRWGTFRNCISLSSVIIQNGVTEINANAFRNCNSLASIEIPSSVIKIEEQAFFGCDSLKSAIIQDGVTTIGKQTFECCPSLSSIIIPSSVKTIGADAFHNIPHITYYGSATGAPWGAKSIN